MEFPFSMTMPQVLLLVLVLALFVAVFLACYRSSKGTDSMKALLRHAQELSGRFGQAAPPDPFAERAALERLLNKVKVANPGASLSANDQLRFEFTRSYNLVAESAQLPAHRNQPHWTQLSLLMRDFYESYFAQRIENVKDDRKSHTV